MNMKSKLEIRLFAVEKAVELLGTGAPEKDVVIKAKEIETYVVGSAELPEYIDEGEQITSAIATLAGVVLGFMNPPKAEGFTDFKDPEPAAKAMEKETSAKQKK